jgi:D-serine deaminase-like pyridoxal phosphate-dependent protein
MLLVHPVRLPREVYLLGKMPELGAKIRVAQKALSEMAVNHSLVSKLYDEPIDWRYKGIPPTEDPILLREVEEAGWNVRAGDLLLPLMVLKQSALDHNIMAMARFCSQHGVSLAPHGKTSMAPQLFQRQLDAGAWGITAATVSQAAVYRGFGIERILLASQLVDPQGLRWVSKELDRHPAFDFYCLIDSVPGVRLMTEVLEECEAQRPLKVLVELGMPSGRTGCRTIREAEEVARAANASPVLELAGVEGFEGLIHAETPEATLEAVDRFLRRVRELASKLAASGAFDHLSEVVVSAGGSAYFDRVAHYLSRVDSGVPTRLVLRSGCYITHDSEMYEEVSPLAGRGSPDNPLRLRPAFELWATVWSRPERDLAILGFGKRDAPSDYRLPVPVRALSKTGGERDVRGRFVVTDLNDQHAYVRVPPDDVLAIGDVVVSGISHPCTAFDKWRFIPVVNDDYDVVDGIRTFF